ncbi:MAG TPA: Gmad2 immunoglobulin-like domain-containing protein [Anaerolineales bacterium]|nr:Gmad2 immunoglobulin-like domain-containing protein [Anaerolineales bacterium]HRQ92013.1 Gmad2 immunoglobulin-like domain-containing protein [Anaerolineales bacterium]
MKPIHAVLCAFASLALAACNLPGTPAQPTATTIDVVLPSATAPSQETAPPQAAPTQASDGQVALEAILLGSPDFASQLVSPVTVSGQSRPTFEQTLVIAIYDEAGNQLALQPTTIAADVGNPGPFSAELSFSVPYEQAGRVAVMEHSAMDGGILHLTSVEVTLLPSGSAVLLPQPVAGENIDIQFPLPNSAISGGTFTVSGFSEYYFESNLGLMLCGAGEGGGEPHAICGDSNNVLASTYATIDAPDIGQPGPFSGTLTWSVAATTPGRIVLYAESMRDGGLLHLNSIPVLIQP